MIDSFHLLLLHAIICWCVMMIQPLLTHWQAELAYAQNLEAFIMWTNCVHQSAIKGREEWKFTFTWELGIAHQLMFNDYITGRARTGDKGRLSSRLNLFAFIFLSFFLSPSLSKLQPTPSHSQNNSWIFLHSLRCMLEATFALAPIYQKLILLCWSLIAISHSQNV